MGFGFITANSTVEVSDNGDITIIRHDEDNQQLSDQIRYRSDDLEDSLFDTPTDFMKVTDEQINLLFSQVVIFMFGYQVNPPPTGS